LNLHEQALGQETLGDEAVCAVAATFVPERQAIQFGKNDHPQVGAGEADLLCSLQPIDPRHAEIEENQVGLFEGRELYSIYAVTGGPNDLKASSKFEIIADGAKSSWRIIGNENSNRPGKMHHFSVKKGHQTFLRMKGERGNWNWRECLVKIH